VSCWRRVWVAARSAAALCFCCVCVPAADANDSDEAHVLLFSGRDIWRNGAFTHGGFIVAPSGLDQDGLLLKIMLSAGLYRYDAQNLGKRVVGAEWLTNILPGWRIKRGNAEFKVFMGPEIQNHYLRPPTTEMMIAADVSLSSIATSNSARIAYGWRVLEEMLGGIYIGPEVQYFGSDGYRHGRLGMHITSMKTEDTEWSAAAGWARDSAGRSSPYVRLSILTRR
jgi:cellulose biosynthesis protein BcsS